MCRAKLDARLNALRTAVVKLEATNPLAVLSRGYSVLENGNGEIISALCDVEVGEDVTVRVSDGELCARITQKKGKEG